MKKLLVILSVIAAAPGGFALAAGPCRSGAGGYCAQLAAVIPGLEFIPYNGASFGDFLSSIYIFALGLVGISAFIMFVYAGFKYMTAGDNDGRVKDARKKMGDAVLGLTLAFLSWLILRTINPDLIRKFDFSIPKLSAPGASTTKPPPVERGDASQKLPGTVDLGRTCDNTPQCQTGLVCDAATGLCADANRVKTGPAGLGQGELCSVNVGSPNCAPPLHCKRINPLTPETRCY